MLPLGREWRLEAASYSHVNRIARRMREIDRLECAASGHDPKQALVLGLRASTLRWTALMDGQPVAMFGVVPVSVLDRRGLAWMLGTDEISLGPRQLLTLAKPMLRAMRAEFSRLENWISEENHASARWLKRLGFQFDGDTLQTGGLVMRRFSIGF